MPNRPSKNWSLIVLSSSSPREALLELEGRLLDAGRSSSPAASTELACELELLEEDDGRLLELELLPAWLDEPDELDEDAPLLEEGRLLEELEPEVLPELLEALLEEPDEELLPEEAETSSEGSSPPLDADELELELETLLELLELPEELDEELLLEELEELPPPMPLWNETVRVLLTTWLPL